VEQERRAGLHGILIIAETRQADGYETRERLQRIGARYRPAKFLKLAEVIAEALLDQRHHASRGFVLCKAEPVGRNNGRRQSLAIFRVEIPFTARRLISVYQDCVLSPHFAIEVLHPPCSTPLCPLGEAGATCEEAGIGAYLDRPPRRGFPAFDHRLHTPLARFGHNHAVGRVPGHSTLNLCCQIAAVVWGIKWHIIDRYAPPTQLLGEVAHGR
jgi:hypothetical protein